MERKSPPSSPLAPDRAAQPGCTTRVCFPTSPRLRPKSMAKAGVRRKSGEKLQDAEESGPRELGALPHLSNQVNVTCGFKR